MKEWVEPQIINLVLKETKGKGNDNWMNGNGHGPNCPCIHCRFPKS